MLAFMHLQADNVAIAIAREKKTTDCLRSSYSDIRQ